MACNMQTFSRMLKMLRENASAKEKREALTYICSNSKKIESLSCIKEDQYKELCKLVVDTFSNGSGDTQYEAYETLNVIIQDFKDHTLNLFEAMSHRDPKIRLKLLKLLEVVEDNAVSAVAYDASALNFFNDCVRNVQPNAMPWLAQNACTDDLQALTQAENRQLTEDQRLEEETINYTLTLLKRLYKVAAITFDDKIHRFDELLINKVMLLAYMGHKRQRGTALKLLQQALGTNILSHVRSKLTDAWTRYKAALQSTYCKRMLLLVAACELDWATQWNISIQFLGIDLHRGAGIINNLLSVEEKAFKSTDTIIRRQAFLSWKLLVDNFALDPQELATARRIKLLCIPLNAKNSKTELIALTKLEVWWHVIIKLYKDISKFVNPIITQFLNFCFGPLGDTPLLSSKFDVVASPGKRFFKTKLVAVDALCQLLVTKHENHNVFSPILEERLPHSMTDSVFQECYKSVIHSVAEALLVLSLLTDEELKNRYQLSKVLWTSLVNYVQESKMKDKEPMYKDMILVITELTNYAVDRPMIKNLIFDTILFEMTDLSKNYNNEDGTLLGFILKLLQTSIFDKAEKKHYDALKSLSWQVIKSKEGAYRSNALKCLKEILETLNSLPNLENQNMTTTSHIWCVVAEIFEKYMYDLQEINEGSITEHNFKCIESVLVFPFIHISVQDQNQVSELAKVWKNLYNQFELRADLISSVKPNEVLLKVASVMQCALDKNKESYSLITTCLDTLLSTINYKQLLESNEIPSILRLIVDLIMYSLTDTKNAECESALKALSAVLITVFGHNSEKVIMYLQVCKPAVELILASKSETLLKEIISTWETIVSIFKGLQKLVNYDLLSSYKKAIERALKHSNKEIESQALSILDIRNILNNDAKCLLEELGKQARKDRIQNNSETTKKKKDNVGKLLTQGKLITRNSGHSGSLITSNEKAEKKGIILEPDSQDYVFIKTDLKFDVSRLTEHQKESLKRRREDIPALYNDLSQSSSQDTQNLQEWFDKKNKLFEEADNTHAKNDNVVDDILDHDANKENKIESTGSETADKAAVVDTETKLIEDSGKNTSHESMQKEKSDAKKSEETRVDESKSDGIDANRENDLRAGIITADDKTLNVKLKEKTESSTDKIPSDSVGKLVSSASREDIPEDKVRERQSSPSVLDNGKRRSRNNTAKAASASLQSAEAESQAEQVHNVQLADQRTLRRTQKVSDNLKDKPSDEVKRGVKRKSASDSESEGCSRRGRRKLTASSEISSDNESVKSTESDNATTSADGLTNKENRRTKTEISRLRINMVFNSPLPTRRRSKVHEDNNNEGNARSSHSPENKGTKPKSVDTKIADVAKKATKSVDKEEKLNVNQHTRTRRSLRSTKPQAEKSSEPGEVDVATKLPQSKENEIESESPQNEESIPTKVAEKLDEKSNKISIPTSDTDVLVRRTETKENASNEVDNKKEDQASVRDEEKSQAQDDTEDIIEDSQASTSKIGKMYNEKQCFIKINKIENAPAIKPREGVTENVEVDISTNCNIDDSEVLKNNVQVIPDTTTNDSTISDSTISDSSSLSTQVIESSQPVDKESIVSEIQKSNDATLSMKSSLTGFSSPKGSSKRYSKFKPYSGQGRAAHMLGLVTKQARTETDCQTITIEDEPVSKKLRPKDTENEVYLSKKERLPTAKDVDKPAGSCSSRQEKIFNNMRSNDYSSSPSIKLFCNLRNDGEKISPKGEKTIDSVPGRTETQSDKAGEGAGTSTSDKEEVPMLEWSSANPPSLTASPSASILKRNRQSAPEPDPECTTPNKRKRVSFADPPVSKEMEYEITNTGSPHKINKFSSPRGLSRKDSPFRFRQTRLKLIHTDPEKLVKEELHAENASEIDLQCERENELLTKIAEELEYSENMVIDVDANALPSLVENEAESETTVENNVSNNKVTIDNLSREFEVAECATASKNDTLAHSGETNTIERQETLGRLETSTSGLGNLEPEESETQQDIFGGAYSKRGDADPKRGDAPITDDNMENKLCDVLDSSVGNNSLESLKFNVTADSSADDLSEKQGDSEILEDTVDAGNMTGLNSTASSDEIFCGKLIRTSTHAAESVEEQDTLPVTDSVFGSLPLSQDSQNTSEFHLEIPPPEALDSVQPIYPSLMLCQEPIKSIVGQLTNPLWVQHLSTYFADRDLKTIGDLAKLSEREVNRIPVKGNPKVTFVKNVLRCFEKTYCIKALADISGQLGDTSSKSNVSLNVIESSVTRVTAKQDSVANPVGNKTDSCNSTRVQSSGGEQFDEDETNYKDLPGMPDKSIKSSLDDNTNCNNISDDLVNHTTLNVSTVDICSTVLETLPKSSTDLQNLITTQTTCKATTSTTTSVSALEHTAGTSNMSVTNVPGTTLSTKSVGTCTNSDSVYLSKTSQKTATKSVAAQTALEDLLDEIDVNLVLESAVRRCSPEKILLQYKNKMRHIPQAELERETIKMLGNENRKNYNEITLKAACRACGVNKVLLRLPDIFSADKQFFVKVLNAYRKKIKTSDCMDILDFAEVKDAIAQKCTSSELAEMLSNKLKDEERQGIRLPMTELSSLNAMLKRMPMDVIISHTVANDELIPSRLVLDIALQNNSPNDIAQALESQSSVVTKKVFDNILSSRFAAEHIQHASVPKESLLDLFKAVSSKLSAQELLEAYYESMKVKLITKPETK